MSVAYIEPKSRTERPRKTEIGTEIAHVTRDSDTTFKVKKSKVKVTGGGGILWRPPHSLFKIEVQASTKFRESKQLLSGRTLTKCRYTGSPKDGVLWINKARKYRMHYITLHTNL